MSTCIKDLYDYDLVKKCYVCKNILLKSNLHKNKNTSDGLYTQCNLCRKNIIMKIRRTQKNIIWIIEIE